MKVNLDGEFLVKTKIRTLGKKRSSRLKSILSIKADCAAAGEAGAHPS